MHSFGSDSGNSVSAQEAREILAAWTNQRQAQGVDPSVNSVTSLASGLGVSEDEVRRMLEDIRVQKRSRELAADILDEQQQHRKRSDVSAAIIAAAVLVFLVLIGGAFFMFRGHSSTPPPAAEIVNIPPPSPPSEFLDLPDTSGVFAEGHSVTHASRTGHVTTIAKNTFVSADKNGSILSLSGQSAIEEVKQRIDLTQKKVEALSAKKNPSEEEKSTLEDDRAELDTLQQGLKLLEGKAKTP